MISRLYHSFEANKPVIYLHDVRSGERRLIASFKGNNSAPAFSPAAPASFGMRGGCWIQSASIYFIHS